MSFSCLIENILWTLFIDISSNDFNIKIIVTETYNVLVRKKIWKIILTVECIILFVNKVIEIYKLIGN